MPSITNVSLPPDLEDLAKLAVAHYEFETVALFFRTCARALIKAHKRGDVLVLPLTFASLSTGTENVR